jgi:hypothetical protein
MPAKQRHGKAYSERSANAQKRINRSIATYYGDSKSDRERALRDLRNGTWHPSARNKARRIPERIARQAQNYPEFLPPGVGEDLKDAAFRNMSAQIGDLDRMNKYGQIANFNAFAVADAVGQINTDALIWLAAASEDEITDTAKWQADKLHPDKPARGTPQRVRDMGWIDSDGNWRNAAWYH